jgi:hypothetical protein
MATKELNVSLDAEGFMTDPNQWTPEIAEAMAEEEGIAPLTERHWQVINWCARRRQEPASFPRCARSASVRAWTPRSCTSFSRKGQRARSPAAQAIPSRRAASKCLSEKFHRVGEGNAFAYPSINPSMGYSDRLKRGRRRATLKGFPSFSSSDLRLYFAKI